MDKRVIRVNIKKEPELYEELMLAMTNHAQHEGCYVIQYSENVGGEGQMVGEFMLREEDPPGM
jgi:hypothetical protein